MAVSTIAPWKTGNYLDQEQCVWPSEGKHILAQYDDDSVVVYQAFCPAIAEYAVTNQKFGGPQFSFSRMSWVKTNFLWMMYRCGWASKANQERVLAVRITRDAFNTILANALTGDDEKKLNRGPSSVRLQWDPDHHPNGSPLKRRAIQLGLRNDILAKYSEEWIVNIKDITEFVHEQHQFVLQKDWNNLTVAEERIYEVVDRELAYQIKLIDDIN
jgi:hypothetical protein